MHCSPYSFDIGPILLQKQYDVPDRVNTLDLRNFMAERGAEVVSNTQRSLTPFPTPYNYFE